MAVRWMFMPLLVLLAGCAAMSDGSAPSADRGELVLHRALTIPAHRGWVYIQGGQVYDTTGYISFQAVDQYYTHCRLELRQASDRSVTIQPGSFRIVNVRHGEELVRRDGLMVAALELRLASAAGPAIASTTFELHSDDQPQVARLRCAHWEDPWSATPPGVGQIQRTLGEIMTLQPPP